MSSLPNPLGQPWALLIYYPDGLRIYRECPKKTKKNPIFIKLA